MSETPETAAAPAGSKLGKSVTDITLVQLFGEVTKLKADGCRFVTMTCTDLGDALDIFYHFDKNYELYNLRLRLPKGETLTSISGIYFPALVIENELQDMFGLVVSGLAVDYKGRFLISEDAPRAPLAKTGGIALDVRVKQPAVAAPANGGTC